MICNRTRSRQGLALCSMLGFCTAICVFGLSLQAQAAATFATFDAPGAVATFVAHINDGNEIVGSYTDSGGIYHPYFRTPNGLITAFEPVRNASRPSVAGGINDDGVIAGAYGDDIYVGFLRATDGKITRFAPTFDRNFVSVAGINKAGMVAGNFTQCSQNSPCFSFGYVRASDGASTTFNAAGDTYVSAINGKGTIVGYYTDSNSVIHGYVRSVDGTITTLDVAGAGMSSGEGTYVAGSTGTGTVAGSYIDGSGVSHGYVRAPDGTVTTFDVPGTAGSNGTFVAALSSTGAITGYYANSSGATHGYVRAPDGTVTTFDVPGTGTTCVRKTFPVTINGTGVIAGNYIDGNCVQHGFVRIP